MVRWVWNTRGRLIKLCTIFPFLCQYCVLRKQFYQCLSRNILLHKNMTLACKSKHLNFLFWNKQNYWIHFAMLLRQSNQFADVFRMENKADQQSFQHKNVKICNACMSLGVPSRIKQHTISFMWWISLIKVSNI